ncbi:MAG: hypothetical protein GY862_10445, partial [Gammaproteobacteria bacterium]|nr:hypothetical protein [Gammaproteobacteria bacterium]
MPLSTLSKAAAIGSAVKNVSFAPGGNLTRKLLLIGTYDPSILTITQNVPVLITSPEDAGDKFGFGFMLHRLAVQGFLGSGGIETWVIPQDETGGAQSAGEHDWVGSSGVLAGTIHMYIGGIYVPFNVTDGMAAADIATACGAVITAMKELPVTDATATTVNTITAKSEGTWGDDITLRFNQRAGEEFPTGVAVATTAMSGGSGTPDIGDALDGLGTGDSANEAGFTGMAHGYGQVTAVLDDISAYVGTGNDFVGLYSKTVSRPFRVLTGDTAMGSAGFMNLITLAGNRKTDRANGVIAVPDSPNHPAEIAALTMGIMEKTNLDRAAQSYIGLELPGIIPGATSQRWTSSYDSRDAAVKIGISPTLTKNGGVTLQNVLTFYHPDGVPIDSNGYRSMRNIAIIQNILSTIRERFEAEKWQGISIVEDVTKVSSAIDRQKARDATAVIDELVGIAQFFMSRAWIYDDSFTIEKLQLPGAVTIRGDGSGFDNLISVILSGEG